MAMSTTDDVIGANYCHRADPRQVVASDSPQSSGIVSEESDDLTGPSRICTGHVLEGDPPRTRDLHRGTYSLYIHYSVELGLHLDVGGIEIDHLSRITAVGQRELTRQVIACYRSEE